MAGKESSGFENASFDLFRDRIWVVCPLPITDAGAIESVKKFIVHLGALPFEMSAVEHDRTVALTSHVPQVVASVLAAQLLDLTDSYVQVSGQGLRDMTRIASSDPQLWSEILLANAAFVGPLLAKISAELADVANSLNSKTPAHIASAMIRGNQGRALVPGKHGEQPTAYETVSIMIQDAPGQLAAIFAVADSAEVNVEDVRIDHALGKAVAVVELDVDPAKASILRNALTSQGWTLRNSPRS